MSEIAPKRLIFINGTMGVGKTSTAHELAKILPSSVLLDGDNCWDMNPFVVNDTTKELVLDNITYLLNNFIDSGMFQNIIFCWVMHRQSIINAILDKLRIPNGCELYCFTLTCRPDKLKEHLHQDIVRGKRTADVMERAFGYAKLYEAQDTVKIDVSDMSAQRAAYAVEHALRD